MINLREYDQQSVASYTCAVSLTLEYSRWSCLFEAIAHSVGIVSLV